MRTQQSNSVEKVLLTSISQTHRGKKLCVTCPLIIPPFTPTFHTVKLAAPARPAPPSGGSHPPVNYTPLPRFPCTRCLRERSRAGVLQYCQSWRRIYNPSGFLVSLLHGVTGSLGMDASSSSSKSPVKGAGRTYFPTWLRIAAFLMTGPPSLSLSSPPSVCLSTAKKPRVQPGCTQ